MLHACVHLTNLIKDLLIPTWNMWFYCPDVSDLIVQMSTSEIHCRVLEIVVHVLSYIWNPSKPYHLSASQNVLLEGGSAVEGLFIKEKVELGSKAMLGIEGIPV